jgi:selenide,water dikinase
MARASGVEVEIDLDAVPVLKGALQTAGHGLLSSLHPQNAKLTRVIRDAARLEPNPRMDLLFDPQTAGGLLAGVPAARSVACLGELRAAGYVHSAVIGRVVSHGGGVECIAVRS